MRAIKVVAYDVNVCLFNHYLPLTSFKRVIILNTNMFVFKCFIASQTFYCITYIQVAEAFLQDALLQKMKNK